VNQKKRTSKIFSSKIIFFQTGAGWKVSKILLFFPMHLIFNGARCNRFVKVRLPGDSLGISTISVFELSCHLLLPTYLTIRSYIVDTSRFTLTKGKTSGLAYLLSTLLGVQCSVLRKFVYGVTAHIKYLDQQIQVDSDSMKMLSRLVEHPIRGEILNNFVF